MATAESYFRALLALSGNALLKDARTSLLASITDTDLEQVAKHAMAHPFSRPDSEAILSTVLDLIAKENSKSDEPVVKVEGEEEMIDSEDARDLALVPNREGERRSKRKSVIDAKFPTSKRKRVSRRSQPFIILNDGQANTRSRRRMNRAVKFEALPQKVKVVPLGQTGTQEQGVRSDGQEMATLKPPMIFWVLNVNDGGFGVWKQEHELPSELQVAIRARFDSLYRSTEEANGRFRNLVKRVDEYQQLQCVGSTYAGVASTYRRSGGNQMRACDGCVDTGSLCAKVLKVCGSLRFGIYALPEDYHQGKAWTDLGYWVQS